MSGVNTRISDLQIVPKQLILLCFREPFLDSEDVDARTGLPLCGAEVPYDITWNHRLAGLCLHHGRMGHIHFSLRQSNVVHFAAGWTKRVKKKEARERNREMRVRGNVSLCWYICIHKPQILKYPRLM